MMGVAAECLTEVKAYAYWSDEAIYQDGSTLFSKIERPPSWVLPHLAALGRRLSEMRLRREHPLWISYCRLRSRFVSEQFATEAHESIAKLGREHGLFVNLKAYIDLKGEMKDPSVRTRRHTGARLAELAKDEGVLAAREELQATGEGGVDALRLISDHSALVILGDAGAGKSTVAREWEYQLSKSIDHRRSEVYTVECLCDGESQRVHVNPSLPRLFWAKQVVERVREWDSRGRDRFEIASVLPDGRTDSWELLAAGACSIMIDALNELAEEDRRCVAAWIMSLHEEFPLSPLLICHRQYNWIPGLLPFPVVTLQKVSDDQARQYVHDYMRENRGAGHESEANRLITVLFDPEHEKVRDLARIPLFLWMIVERYQKATDRLPSNRAQLFGDFAQRYVEERHHEEEPSDQKPGRYGEKSAILACLGHHMVQEGKRDLLDSEVARLAESTGIRDAPGLIAELVASGMLLRSGGSLRFMHQSFEEYFAARYILEHMGDDIDSLREKVQRFAWHDTVVLLLAFGGDHPDTVARLIECTMTSIRDAELTARCLRMAEGPDEDLVKRFVASQEQTLRCLDAGNFAHRRASVALFEYGRPVARQALRRVAQSEEAPEDSRALAIERLAEMVGRVWFENEREEIRRELGDMLPGVFNAPAPEAVHEAAIEAVRKAELKDLSLCVSQMLNSETWSLCIGAFETCRLLGLNLPPQLRAAFAERCRQRIVEAEEELNLEKVTSRMEELNNERVAILQHIASPVNLPALLRRRFSFGIQERVKRLVD
ncbi:MAG: hypothetical protein HQ592_15620, partial [Planctomycetes bacterium]|nr:hypothetical protein [Planctomycetota bacterium]